MAPEHEAELARLRRTIGELDAELIRVLARRFEQVDRLAVIKHAEGVPVEDAEREQALCRMYEAICAREGLDAASAQRIFHAIFEESKRRQRAARHAPSTDAP